MHIRIVFHQTSALYIINAVTFITCTKDRDDTWHEILENTFQYQLLIEQF
jgi:hypothetical protein